MSVDDTIRELSGTIAQLGLLVGKINEQIGGLSSRVNITLQTFDDSVSGIARDANKMTEQVDQTIAQIPGSWTFYVLFFSLLVVLLLLSVLILINLVAKIQSICRRLGAESSRSSTPLILHHSESKQPILHNPAAFGYSRPAMPVVEAPTAATESSRLRHIAVEMESEPRRFGIGSAQPRTYQQQQRMQMRQQQATAADILSNGNNGSEQQRSRGTAPAANSPRSQRGAASESVLPSADQIPPPESSQPKTKPEPLARTLRL